jgi:hypothetical protein
VAEIGQNGLDECCTLRDLGCPAVEIGRAVEYNERTPEAAATPPRGFVRYFHLPRPRGTNLPAEAIHEKPVSRGGGSCARWLF